MSRVQIASPAPKNLNVYNDIAQMAELVDALASGASAERRGGSNPLLGTKVPFFHKSRKLFVKINKKLIVFFLFLFYHILKCVFLK